jgi:nitrogen fixation protein FixH
MKWVSIRIGSLILLLVLAACGSQGKPTTSSVDLHLALTAESEKQAVGETTLIVTLSTAKGEPVDGANVKIHGDMDHEGMASIDRESSESSNGEYRVPFEWTMGGGWVVNVTARLPDGSEVSKKFDFFVDAVSSQSIINHNPDVEKVPVNISYQSDNNPAIGGDATVMITLSNKDGSPITDAAVKVTGNMEHADMMPIAGEGKHTQNGQYAVPLRWSMAGKWIVTVTVILADGHQFEQKFDQTVVMP